MRHSRSFAAFVLASVLLLAGNAAAELRPDQVLVVVNDASPISVAIGAYYAGVRAIPPQNVLHLAGSTPSTETITRAQYNAAVRDPIAAYLQATAPALKDQVRCILLTKGVPLRVANTTGSGISQTVASVDSELTQLFTGLVPANGHEGWLPNPYYGSPFGFEQFAPVPAPGISYLVCRLDGYADAIDGATGVPVDVKNLIDRAQTPAAGAFVLDGDPTKVGGYALGESWLNAADTQLASMGLPFVHDTTTAFVKDQPAILGYASWGSNDSNNEGPPYYGAIGGSTVPGAFLPGSLATDFVSTSARTFAWPPSYGQSLVADLIRMGCTAVNGHTDEPYLNAVSQPDRLFPAYARGLSVAEAFYGSIQFLSWENVVVCDPLMKRKLVASQVLAVSPAFGPQAGGTTLTITGKNFASLGSTTVTVGGVPAQVTSVSATSIVAKSPPRGPGPATVVVTDLGGSAAAPVPFLYTPALMTAQPIATIGANWSFTITGPFFGDAWTTFEGTPAPPFPIPPFGDFLLDPLQPIAELVSGTIPSLQKQQTVTLLVPNNPLLQGTTHHLQGLAGGGITGAGTYLLTNGMTVVVQ